MLTKSHFKNFLACSNEFWLDHHLPRAKVELSLNDQLRREAGYEVEGFARTLPIFTQPSGYRVEYGKEFESGELYAKADIVTIDDLSGDRDSKSTDVDRQLEQARESLLTDHGLGCLL